MQKIFKILFILSLFTFPVITFKPVYACLTSNPGNVSCSPANYKADPTVKVRVTQTSEVKVWFPNNEFPVVLVVNEPGKQQSTYYWDQRPNGVSAWDTRTVTVDAGQSKEISYTFKICYSGDKNSCVNAYGWMPANTGNQRFNCGTGCQCSGYPNGTYYGQTQFSSFVNAVQGQLNGASFYNLNNSGYTLFNASQRQAGTADTALTCWNDNYSSGAGADFNDWGVLWTVKAVTQAVAPTVSTSAMSNVLATSATANGNVTADGGSAILERGFVYSSTVQTPDLANGTKVVATGTTGTFTANITGLTTGTTYRVRAFARNASGTSYGAVVTFVATAGGTPTVTTPPATPSTTHVPTDTGIAENFLFFAGAILYGVGIVVFMGAKFLGKENGRITKFRIVL